MYLMVIEENQKVKTILNSCVKNLLPNLRIILSV